MIAGGNHTSVSCREAAKGVPMVFLSCNHSTNSTPSVSLTLDSSPTGEPRLHATSPERGGRRIAPEGFPAVRRIPFKMHQGEFAEAPLASPGGKLARPVRGVTEEGWRQPKYCLHFVQWYQPQIIADCFPLFSFIYNMEKVFIKQAPFSTHRTLHENFGARHPSSVFFVNRFRSAD